MRCSYTSIVATRHSDAIVAINIWMMLKEHPAHYSTVTPLYTSHSTETFLQLRTTMTPVRLSSK
jgi:hypothetical protein